MVTASSPSAGDRPSLRTPTRRFQTLAAQTSNGDNDHGHDTHISRDAGDNPVTLPAEASRRHDTHSERDAGYNLVTLSSGHKSQSTRKIIGSLPTNDGTSATIGVCQDAGEPSKGELVPTAA